MKKLLLFIALVLAIGAHAAHLEFMGIPINGSISYFQEKLIAKGCTLDKYNKELPTGIRGFKGVFAGKDCNIIVWFNHRTKQVYQVRAIVECSSLEIAHSTFDYYKDLLNQKYSDVALTSDMLDEPQEPYNYSMMIIEPPIEVGALLIGSISIHIIDYETFPETYGLAITYEDMENSKKNEQTTLEDL